MESSEPPRRSGRERIGDFRHHFLTGALSFSSAKADGSSQSVTVTGISVDYIFDFGYFGFGPRLSLANTESGKTKTSLTDIGLLLRLNVRENRRGNDVVPNLILKFGSKSEEVSSSTLSAKASSSYVGANFGLDIYPFSNFVAFTPSIGIAQVTDEDGAKASAVALSAGFALSF